MQKTKVAATVLAVVVLGVVETASGQEVLPLHKQSSTRTFGGAVRSVIVSTDAGDVSVRPGSPTNVRATSRWNFTAPTVSESLDRRGVLTVRARCPSAPMNQCSVDLSLTVPATASLSAATEAGDVAASGSNGPRVVARSGAGEVGLIAIASPFVSATSEAGDVVASLRAAASSLTLTSHAGDVNASVPRGIYDVQATSDAGTVTVAGMTKRSSSLHHIVAHSDAGDVTIKGH